MCRYVSLVDSLLPLTKSVLRKGWDPPQEMVVTLILQARRVEISCSCVCVVDRRGTNAPSDRTTYPGYHASNRQIRPTAH